MDTPGFEGKVNYSGQMNDVDVSLWAGFIYQSIDTVGGAQDFDATGWDLGGKVSSGPFSLVGYYYNGEGIGTTGFLFERLREQQSGGGLRKETQMAFTYKAQ